MKILIAEDDPISRRVLTATLLKWGHEVVTVANGVDAWKELHEEHAPRLAILDWMMPGLSGVEICQKVRQQTAAPPYLILLTALSRKEDLVTGLESGADDYLTKPFDRQELKVRLQAGIRIVELQNRLAAQVRELEAAVSERRRAEEALRNLSLTDDLTSLYNRRGFFTLAMHHLKTTRRTGQNSLLVYCDMDGLKLINDTLGHAEGSIAIRQTAEILHKTFRDSDIVGRLGGDEFAILALDVSFEGVSNIVLRLEKNLSTFNERSDRPYALALSIGTACIEAGTEADIEDLIARADEAMYAQKRLKKETSSLAPHTEGMQQAVTSLQ